MKNKEFFQFSTYLFTYAHTHKKKKSRTINNLFNLKKMAFQKMKFLDRWLQRSMVWMTKILAYSVNIWCENFCNKTFSVTNMGFGQIESRAKKVQSVKPV